jgi:hypothetical protein
VIINNVCCKFDFYLLFRQLFLSFFCEQPLLTSTGFVELNNKICGSSNKALVNVRSNMQQEDGLIDCMVKLMETNVNVVVALVELIYIDLYSIQIDLFVQWDGMN